MSQPSWEIQFVYFDLDDTLLDHSHAEHLALRDLHADTSLPLVERSFEDVHAAYCDINPVVWKKYSAGEFSKVQAKVGRFEQLLGALDLSAMRSGNNEHSDLAVELADRYLACYADHWQPIDGAFESFERIACELPVGILTNGFSEIQRAKLKRFPALADRSHALVISEEIGHLKPDPRLFERAAADAGVPPSAILYVGDSLHSDVDGGLGAGWKVAWYSNENHDSADVVSFKEWNDLSRVLGLTD